MSDTMSERRSILGMALKRQCPQCGQATLFDGWNRLNKRCDVCGIDFIKDHIDYLIVVYFTTAVITGLFVVLFLVVGFPDGWYLRVAVIVCAAGIMWGSLPYRKALAVAIDFKMRGLQ